MSDTPADGAPSYRDIFEHLSAAIVIVDRGCRITDLNPAAENLLGRSRFRAAGLRLLDVTGDDGSIGPAIRQVFDDGASVAWETTLPERPGGPGEIRVECRMSPLDIARGERLLLVEMIDITRRARINRENALLIQHGAGRQMIRQLAHEIKNPLGGLRGAAQLLGKALPTDELREYTDVIISEADRLAGLVDTLLGPGGPPSKAPANVHEVLEYVLRLVEQEAGENVRLHRDYDPGLPDVELDRDQIVQALLNVIRNAATAMEGAGNLTVRTRARHNFTIGEMRHGLVTTVEIEDDGPGIPRELQDSVFYPLVTSRPDGTGLGLPVAQELLSRHGGLIEFDSRPGRTVFYVHIPTDGTKRS